MRIAINAVSAKRGGAVTYLKNVLPPLRARACGEAPAGDGRAARDAAAGDAAAGNAAASTRGQISVWRPADALADASWPPGIDYRDDAGAAGSSAAVGGNAARLWFDQVALPRRVHAERFDALFSSANFGPLHVRARHVLLVRNPVYFDPTLLSRVRAPKARAFYLAQRLLTLRCAAAADVVLFPTRAMLELVASHAGRSGAHWRVAPYGARPDLFTPAPRLPPEPLELLNVSLYSEQKNLGTLFAALERLDARTPGRYRLRLTAGFHQDWLAHTPFFPNFAAEREAFRRLAARGAADDVDWKTYGALPDLYRAASVFVFPSYTESFGHPLVEAMASALPIVAADVPVNRELCGDAAVYVPPFDVEGWAAALERLARDEALRAQLSARGRDRALGFTWDAHVAILWNALGGAEPATATPAATAATATAAPIGGPRT